MLPVVYGNFLRKNEISRYKYVKMKPKLMLFANCLVAFSLSAALVSGVFWGYEKLFNVPLQDYDGSMLQEYKTLNNELLQQASLLREARPDGVDIKKVLNTFIESRPKDVVISSLDISPSKYKVKCQTKDLSLADSYVSKLDFGNNKKASIASIQQAKDCFEFTIEVTDKALSKKAT